MFYSYTLYCFFYNDAYEIENNGERYGKSEFYKYKDKEDERENVAFDKNRIYFGNIAVSDLDTDKMFIINQNFYQLKIMES